MGHVPAILKSNFTHSVTYFRPTWRGLIQFTVILVSQHECHNVLGGCVAYRETFFSFLWGPPKKYPKSDWSSTFQDQNGVSVGSKQT